TPEKQIPGAAVCLENANVYNAFSTAAANFIEIMNISIILILISLNCCTAQVATCKDDADNNPPNVVSSSIMKSEGNPAWAPSAQNVDRNRDHSIVRTMANFIANNINIKVLAYSDDPPNLPPRNEKSKAKGVLLVDNRANDAAAWFVHTVPNFLAYLGGYSWPPTETAKGHMFLCLSLSEAHLNSVAKAVRYQEPYIYVNNLTPALLNQHIELSNLATGVEIRLTPFLEHAKFTTKGVRAAANIQAFGKHTKSFADMYERVLRNKLSAKIRIWAPSDVRSKSICRGQYHLRKIVSPMQFDGVQVSREADSAKWALVEGKNTVCFTTNDYKATEKQIPGAAVCLENANVYNAFSTAAFFVYKPPNVLSTKLLKSAANPVWTRSAQAIDQGRGHSVFTTMASFIADHMNIKVLAYSDDPPNLPPRNEKSKAKVDSTVTDAAAWFVHTVPNFLAHLGGYSWPPAETTKGHIFLFFVYKPPNVLNTKLLKSALNPVWAPSAQAIDQGAGHSVFTTMTSFVANHANIKILAYSDDPPNLPPRKEKSKSKGVLLIDHTGNDAAAWFVHTVPNFLAHLGGYSWPPAETAKGHMFLCVSFTEVHLNSVAKAIRYQEPYIYANNLSPPLLNQHEELSNLVNGVEVRVTPFLDHSKFITKREQVAANIQAFGKHRKSFADMYAKILRSKLSASIRIWAPSDKRSKSICKGQYHLRKIVSPMQFDGVQVSREADSAKWALVEGKNTVCFTTNDYKVTEKQTPGAAVCLENAERNPTWANSRAAIDQGAGHSIVRTMADYVQNNPRINALAYSDDPPNLPLRNEKSKAKGVLLVDNAADAAAWFVHTAPNFLAHLGGYSWPQSETTKGHMFLCLSFDKAHLNLVGKAIRHQEPYIYANNLPVAILNQYMELSNLVNGVDARITPFLEHAKFTTKAVHAVANIQAFGKHSKSFADMYARILRKKFSASIRIWAPSDARSKSICNGQYQLRKIVSPMQLAGSQVSREADSAKWALVEGKNTEPYIYANNMPAAILSQHIELSNLATGVEIRITPFLEHAKFVTKAAQAAANIQAFGKHTKSFADIYAKVLRNKLSASIRIWAPSDARSKSICKGQYQLRKIASPMQLADSQVSREADSTRWALVEGKNTVCFTTNDYK
ncbi:Deoxyribonuclease-2-alpha, partial [Trichinella papuae]